MQRRGGCRRGNKYVHGGCQLDRCGGFTEHVCGVGKDRDGEHRWGATHISVGQERSRTERHQHLPARLHQANQEESGVLDGDGCVEQRHLGCRMGAAWLDQCQNQSPRPGDSPCAGAGGRRGVCHRKVAEIHGNLEQDGHSQVAVTFGPICGSGGTPLGPVRIPERAGWGRDQIEQLAVGTAVPIAEAT